MNEPSAPTGHSKKLRWALIAARWLSALAVIAVLVTYGSLQLRGKIAIVKPIQFIGHADDAAYAAMGESLLAGRGLQVNYISTFYIPYPPTITHREDHWPPFMGFAIAPCFWILGKSAWVAKLPAMFFASIGLPLTTALLAYALSRRGYVALLAGLLMMAHPFMYAQSLRTLSDVANAMLVAGFCGSVLLARRHPWMHLLAGAFLAGAYYAKGSELFLLALYPLMTLLSGGFTPFRRGWLYGGIATALLLMAPFWYSSYTLYGSPFFSTQNFVASFYGLEDWESNMYRPYWGHNLPKPSDRWNKHGAFYKRFSHMQVEEATRLAFTASTEGGDVWSDFGKYGAYAHKLLLGAQWRSFDMERGQGSPSESQIRPINEWPMWPWELVGALAVLLLLVLLPTWPFAALFLWLQRRRHPKPKIASEKVYSLSLMAGPALALLLVIISHILFLAYCWQVLPRFIFPIMPVVAALGCTAASRAFEWPLAALLWTFRQLARRFWYRDFSAFFTRASALWPTLITLLLAATLLIKTLPATAQIQTYIDPLMEQGGYPFEDIQQFSQVGRLIAKKLPTAIVMCRNPWELQFYLGPQNHSICVPYPDDDGDDGAKQIFAIAKYYGVTHYYLDETRAPLEPYISGDQPGFKRVPGIPGLFTLDWSKLPKDLPISKTALRLRGRSRSSPLRA